MNLAAVYDEIWTVLAAADIGLTVPDEHTRRARPPAPFMELPEITYSAGGIGLDRIEDLGLVVVFGEANNRKVFDLALEYASTTGERSVKQALESHDYTSCDRVYVRSAEPTIETVQGGNPQLAYIFHLDLTGAP